MKSYTLNERVLFIFFNIFEAIQVIASVLDIGLDVLVCIEFYQQGLWGPFYSSLIVFCLAQAAYAALFVANYGQNVRTVKGRVRAFFIALPVAQLVPVFSWLETFHWPSIDRLLERLGLAPSSQPIVEYEKEVWTLWSYGIQKFRANLGFLVEAIVEAVPQAIIQTYVIVTHGTADALLVVSILMSVFVVASKGYILAYSIHARSFVFNTIAVVADVCGLFATVVWVFAGCSADSLMSPEPNQLYLTWFNLALAVSGLAAVLLFFLSMWTSADDQLKILLYPQRWPYHVALRTGSAVFDLWIIRYLLWALFLVPGSVLVLSIKFTLLPLLHFRSVHPSHYSFPKVNRRMFQYIYGGGKDQATPRLDALNNILRLAVREAEQDSAAARRTYRLAAMGQDLRSIQNLKGYVRGFSRTSDSTYFTSSAQEALLLEHYSRRRNAIYSMPIRPVRRAATGLNPQKVIAVPKERSVLERRSVICWFVMGAHMDNKTIVFSSSSSDSDSDSDSNEDFDLVYGGQAQRRRRESIESLKDEEHIIKQSFCKDFFVGNRWQAWRNNSRLEKFLFMIGMIGCITSIVIGVILTPLLLGLMAMGIFIPIVGASRFLQFSLPNTTVTALSSNSFLPLEAILGLILSVVYVLSVLLLFALFPSVREFQTVYRDLHDFSSNAVLSEDCFYQVGLDAVLDEAFEQYRERLGKQAFKDFLESKTNTDCAKRIMSYLNGTERI